MSKYRVLNSELLEHEKQINHYFALHYWSVSYLRKASQMASDMGIDDAKISLIRNKALKRYQDLPNDDEKAAFRRQVNDALIILKAFSQGLEIGKTIEMDEADEERRNEIRKADQKYIPKPRAKENVQEKGLAGKCGKLGIDFNALMAAVRKG